MSFKIIGTGSYVPDNIVTNDMLSQMVDTSDEWITRRVGVKERRISTGETTADMAIEAAKRAVENSGIDAAELDLIIAASVSSESACPTVAGYVQQAIGASCVAFDINSACSGFLFALETADAYISKGNARKVLVIGAERISRIIDWTDRSTCVIFGDGAGAAILESEEGHYLSSKLSTQAGDDVIDIPSHIGSSPFFKAEGKSPFIMMQGQETFKFAVNSLTSDSLEVLEKAGLGVDDVKYFVPHQANIRIISFAAKKLGVDIEKFCVNLDRYGNTSSASIPMMLDELNREGKLERGDIIVLSAFGGGLSSAACVLKW